MPNLTLPRVSRRTFTASTATVGAALLFRGRAGARQVAAPSPVASPSTDAPTLLLRMEPFGGMQPAELQLIAMPEFSLFEDGAIYRLGPVIAIYPPAALPNLTKMRVSQAAIDAIMDEARKAGLEQPLRVPDQSMTDTIPAHRFLFNDDGTLVESLVWGLMIDAVQAPDWGEEALAQQQALRSLAAYLSNIPFNLPAEDLLEQELPIDPDRLQVMSFEATADLALESGLPNLDQPPLEWPLATSLAELSSPFEPETGADLPAISCVEIAGEDARAVVETSRQGDLFSPWVDNGITYGLLLKPLLPDQSGCQPPAP